MKRLQSLDALRGFDMIWILGLENAIRGLCRIVPGWKGCWLDLQVRHCAWEGLTFYDTIFPLFIFIAGVSFPFSYAKQRERGDSGLSIHLKLFRRVALLILFGMVYNGLLSFKFEEFRYASVLGKIGLAWFVAALLYVHAGLRTRFVALAVWIAGYWALLHVVAPDAPAGASSFSMEGCFPGYLDRLGFTPGFLYGCRKLADGTLVQYMDGSGVPVSVLGSASTAMLGMFAGDLLRSARDGIRTCAYLAGIGAGLVILGLVVSLDCPVVKNLWTPSFALLTGGYSFLMLALFYWLIDVKGCDRWCFFLKVVGLNSIAIYMLRHIVDYRGISRFFLGGVASWFPDPLFVEMLGVTVLCWLTCWFLDRHKVYLKV